MSWDRHNGALEPLMVAVLKKSRRPMSLLEVVAEIQALKPDVFVGKTPKNSLYSIIYRHEQKRATAGLPTRFLRASSNSVTLYTLNPEFKDNR